MGEAFLADVETAGREGRACGAFHLWWLGQAGFLVQWNERHLLIDPYLSDSLTKKYAATDKPHIRMTSLIIAPERLNFINLVTSSHNHTDHLDRETLKPLMSVNPGLKLVIPEANRDFVAERLDCDPAWPLGLDDGQRIEVDGWEITGVASAHEELERDEKGRCRFLGYIFRFGEWTIFHCGDSVRYAGMAERILELAAPGGIDVALLPINGRAPERRVPGNLCGPEAARLAKDIGARAVIPMHYEMFTFNTASPAAFIAEAEKIGQPYRVLRCGERWRGVHLGAQ
jgi:L-ascorbate metabolism protein UlaG (beta-lactamase superfamily)